MAEVIATEQVLVEFVTDITQLESAADVLERTGQVDKKMADSFKRTNTEIQKQQQVVKAAAKEWQDSAKKEVASIEQVRAEMETFVTEFIEGFSEGIVSELQNAGIEFDEFGKIVGTSSEAAKTGTIGLKAELSEVTRQLQQLKLEGQDNSQQYIELTKRAGQLKDAIGDVSTEINLAAANSQSLNGLLDVASGIAAGFALSQGAMALFGDESEQLQEVLLRVNAAMAILQGLQQVQNILQKESAAATLLTNVQRKVQNAQLILENALQSQSIVVRTGAAVAQRALNAAMAANPIGIVVVALAGLIALLATYGRSAAQARAQTSSLNAALGAGADAFRDRQAALEQQADATINALENEGAVGSRIAQQEVANQKLQAAARRERIVELQRLQSETTEAELEQRQALQAEISRLLDAEITDRIAANNLQTRLQLQLQKEQLQGAANVLEAQLAGARKNSAAELALAKQLARARAAVEINEAGQNAEQRLLIEANLRKQLRDLDLQYARVRQQDLIAGLEAQLLKVSQASKAINARTSQEEIDLQKRIIQENARLELLQEGLTENQKLNIQKQSLAQQAALQREFNQNVSRETLEDFISRNNKELAALNITDAERLRLTEENIIAQAEIEIEAAQGLADKIREIEAKRDADIRAIRLQTIQATLQYELEFEQARTGVLRRTQERILAASNTTLQQRIAAINQLAALDIDAINRQQDALEQQHNQGLISEKEYQLQLAKLKDQELAVFEDTEKKKTDAIKDANLRRIAIAIQVAQQILDIVQQAGDQQLEAQQMEIDTQRQRIDDLLEAGAITEKEATARQKRLELEERKLRRQQAQREKDFAVFRAFLAIPQAYLTGLAQGGPILGAIYAGLAAAQAIIIASRAVPKFGKGKKDAYEGPAEIAETGPEFWQTDQGMHYVPKRAFVWVSKKDRVFNPAETRRMLEKPQFIADATYHNQHTYTQTMSIDYARMGKELGKHLPKTGFNFDKQGVTEWVQGYTSFEKYLDTRRAYK